MLAEIDDLIMMTEPITDCVTLGLAGYLHGTILEIILCAKDGRSPISSLSFADHLIWQSCFYYNYDGKHPIADPEIAWQLNVPAPLCKGNTKSF